MTISYRLSDIYNLQMGKTPSRDNDTYWKDGEYEWISIADLSKCDKYISQTKEKITKKAVEESGIHIIPADTVIMSFKLSIGKVAITQKALFSNEAIMAFIDKKVVSISPQYAFYLFSAQNWDAGTNRAVMGSTLNKATLSQYRVLIHDVQTQAEIVERLDKLSDLIRHRRQELQKLDDLVKSQFIEMFGSIRDNRFNFPVGTIGQECVLKSGTSLPVEVENEGGDIPYVKVGDMTYKGSEKYILESSHMVSQMTAESGLFPPGTIIFPKRGGAIGTNKKRITAIPICADLNIMAVIPGKRISAQYLYSYFLAIDLGKLNNGSTVPQINNKDIAPLKILVPPTERQDEFARFVEQTDKSKDIYGLEAAA